MQKLSKKQIIFNYRLKCRRLKAVLNNNLGFSYYNKQYFSLIRGEELAHRKYCPDGVRCGLTVTEACELHAVKYIAEAFAGINEPKLRAYIYSIKSRFFAWSLVSNYGTELRHELNWGQCELEELLNLDYAELMK